jgi:hypothetical protein
MVARGIKTIIVTVVLVICSFAGSCGEFQSGSKELRRLGTTIGSLCNVVSTDSAAVEGDYGVQDRVNARPVFENILNNISLNN